MSSRFYSNFLPCRFHIKTKFVTNDLLSGNCETEASNLRRGGDGLSPESGRINERSFFVLKLAPTSRR